MNINHLPVLKNLNCSKMEKCERCLPENLFRILKHMNNARWEMFCHYHPINR